MIFGHGRDNLELVAVMAAINMITIKHCPLKLRKKQQLASIRSNPGLPELKDRMLIATVGFYDSGL